MLVSVCARERVSGSCVCSSLRSFKKKNALFLLIGHLSSLRPGYDSDDDEDDDGTEVDVGDLGGSSFASVSLMAWSEYYDEEGNLVPFHMFSDAQFVDL